jgi:hypothetical protein
MGRRPNPRIPAVPYRGLTIRLYPRKDGWKATYQFHGQKRQECYGPTQADAQHAAQEAISNQLAPGAIAYSTDEATARALLADHNVSLIEAARFWLAKHSKPLIEATAEQIRNTWLAVREKNVGYQPHILQHMGHGIPVRHTHTRRPTK